MLLSAAGCAGGPGRPAGPPLITSYPEAIKFLESKDTDECYEALMYLGASGDTRAIEPISRKLSDPELVVRLAAVQALRNFSSPLTIEPLRTVLADQDRDLRFSAAVALYELEDYSGEDVLIEGLSSPRPEFREFALLALGKMRSRQAIPGLIKLLRDPRPSLRFNAAYVLGLLRAESAIDPLLDALEDPVSGVRKDSWTALTEITGESFEFHCDGPEALRSAELNAWRQWRRKEKSSPSPAK